MARFSFAALCLQLCTATASFGSDNPIISNLQVDSGTYAAFTERLNKPGISERDKLSICPEFMSRATEQFSEQLLALTPAIRKAMEVIFADVSYEEGRAAEGEFFSGSVVKPGSSLRASAKKLQELYFSEAKLKKLAALRKKNRLVVEKTCLKIEEVHAEPKYSYSAQEAARSEIEKVCHFVDLVFEERAATGEWVYVEVRVPPQKGRLEHFIDSHFSYVCKKRAVKGLCGAPKVDGVPLKLFGKSKVCTYIGFSSAECKSLFSRGLEQAPPACWIDKEKKEHFLSPG